jgi:hypothetical protein
MLARSRSTHYRQPVSWINLEARIVPVFVFFGGFELQNAARERKTPSASTFAVSSQSYRRRGEQF